MTRMIAAPVHGNTTTRAAGMRMRGFAQAALMSIVLAGCATQQEIAIQSADDGQIRDVMSQAIELVATRYIDPIEREQIAVNAIDGLSNIDPKIRVSITPEMLVLGYDGRTLRDLPLPSAYGDERDTMLWTEMAIKSLGIYRAYSNDLRQSDLLQVEDALVSGSIRNLDRYSRYEGPNKAESERNRRDGFIGIGVTLIGGDGYPVIKTVHEDSPAAKIGLNVGDQIVSVNGLDLYGKSADFATDLLHGEEGSRVAIEVNLADSGQIIPAEIMRERVISRTVFAEIRNNVLIARLTSFNSATASALANEILKADLYPGGLRGVVLDLRGNRGGLLQQGVGVADLFLAGGPIGNTNSRVTAARHVFVASPEDLTHGAPLVILIDGRTASSAEFVSASLQDRNRAVLVGSTSFGKGAVQAINDLPNKGTLTFTWSRLTVPSGYTFDRLGLYPSVCTNEAAAGAVQTGTQPGAKARINTALAARENSASIMAQWRALDFQDEKTRRNLRELCPPRQADGKSDLDIALELIRNQTDYRVLAQLPHSEIADTSPSQ